MPEFAIIQQNAKQLSKRIARSYGEQQGGCYTFFTAIIPSLMNRDAMEDAHTIGLMATSLNDDNDEDLMCYLRTVDKDSDLTSKQFEKYKNKVLIGMYLMIWSQYNALISTHLNSKMIGLFQMDLEIASPTDDKLLFDSSLSALGLYCCFIYQHRNQNIYGRLYERLDPNIQANIHTLRTNKQNDNSSWYGICTGILSSLGLNNMS